MADIEGRVAAWVTEHQLALDVGTNDGVAVGWRVTVWNDMKVRSPDSNEQLGIVSRPLLEMVVVEVQDLLCVAESIETHYDGISLSNIRVEVSTSRGASSDYTKYTPAGTRVTLRPEGDTKDA